MRKSKRRGRHSLPFCLFLAVVTTTRLAAQSIEDPYWHRFIEDADGHRLSLASGSNLSLTGTVASVPIGGGGLLAPDAIIVWQGGSGGNANVWNRPQNWFGGAQPTINDTAQFDDTSIAGNLAPSIGATATSVGAILFAAGTTNAYNISGTATLTIGSATVSGITNASATNQQFSVSNIALGVSQTWDVQSTGNLSFSSNVALGANGLTLSGSSAGQGTISGAISGTGGTLIKTGTGTWTVSGNNSYTGTTTVNGGTLLVNGAGDLGTGTVTVNNGGTLGGTATNLNNPSSITVAAGGNLAPGTIGTAGHLTIGASPLTLSPGANFRVDLLGTGQGTTYDFLTAPGSAGTGFVFANSNLIVHVGFATTTAMVFTIVHNGGGFGGQQFAQGGFVQGDDGKIYSITYTGDSINLQWTGQAVPEPSTYIGGVLAIAGIAFTQRRRLRKSISFNR